MCQCCLRSARGGRPPRQMSSGGGVHPPFSAAEPPGAAHRHGGHAGGALSAGAGRAPRRNRRLRAKLRRKGFWRALRLGAFLFCVVFWSLSFPPGVD